MFVVEFSAGARWPFHAQTERKKEQIEGLQA